MASPVPTPSDDVIETGMRHSAWFVGFLLSLAALWVIYKKWDTGRVDRRAKEKYDCDRTIEDRATLYQIKKELHPNTGSSVRDAVDRMEAQIKELAGEHKEMAARIDWIYKHLFEYEGRATRSDEE